MKTANLLLSFVALFIDGETPAPVADEPMALAFVGSGVEPPAAKPKAVRPIPPLRSVLAALDCGCQSGKRCTCHTGGAHCNCAANMRRAKVLYPKAILKPKAKAKPANPKARRVASR